MKRSRRTRRWDWKIEFSVSSPTVNLTRRLIVGCWNVFPPQFDFKLLAMAKSPANQPNQLRRTRDQERTENRTRFSNYSRAFLASATMNFDSAKDRDNGSAR